ncbi:MAG TPA: right-handed parallel beta-helix repeat-containing protein, partial [Anaerolineae bacterium]|nr:right-handed parallel beta-helix repeat-containing protein [Anaerolineae bacterium]
MGTRLEFDNSAGKFPWITNSAVPYFVWFYGTKVDSSLDRGAVYNVTESDINHISVIPRTGGDLVALTGDGEDMMVMTDLQTAYYTMLHPYPPVAGEAAHGAYMVSATLGVNALDLTIAEGNGDSMLIHTSRDVLVSGNVFLGARMGAVWVGDLCDNVVVRNNYVDGGNGSRVLSVEKSSRNVVIADNTFINGGRGSWINRPRGILISNNVFVANNGKNTPDPYVGRRSWQNGGYDNYEPMYFTTHNLLPYANEPWGPITIVSNVMDTGSDLVPSNMIHIHDGARDVHIAGNEFKGFPRYFIFNSSVENVTFGYNSGILSTNWGHFDEVVAVATSSIRVPHELADNSYFLTSIPAVTPGNPEST